MANKPITRERLLRILDGQAAKTAAAIAGLDERTLCLPARDDGWTAKDILAHMATGHQGMLALAKGTVPGGQSSETFDLNAYNQACRERCLEMSVAEVQALLEEARGQVRAYIEQLDESEYATLVRTPWMGDHPRGQFLMYPALHEGGHRAELEKWRATLQAEKA